MAAYERLSLRGDFEILKIRSLGVVMNCGFDKFICLSGYGCAAEG